MQPKSKYPPTGRCSAAEGTGGTAGAAVAVATAVAVAEDRVAQEISPYMVWFVLFDNNPGNLEKCLGGGRASYMAVGFRLRCMFPLTRHFAPRRSAQTEVAKRSSLSFLNVEFYWTSLSEPRIPSHGFHPSFSTYHPLTSLLMKPFPPAQTRVQAMLQGLEALCRLSTDTASFTGNRRDCACRGKNRVTYK